MQTEKVIDYIVEWLKKYCEDAGLEGFVIGVSGGIDSAVTSTICSKTSKKVICLNMPIYQNPDQILLSDIHVKWLEMRYKNVIGIKLDISPSFKALESTLPPDIQDNLTMANSRARLRMLTLYAFASHHNLLVAGTGNKVEDFGIGFYTKYGDGGVDISPIADLMKSEVYFIAQHLDIIDEIRKAPPTDGLWGDNRTDETQLGATYSELEKAMQFISENGNIEELSSREKQVLDIYRKFNNTNKHKMEPIPVVKIPASLK